MSKPSNIDVYGIGNPLVDLLVHVSSEFLTRHELEKDRMYLVDEERQSALLQDLNANSHSVLYAPGGSAANTMIGIAQLGGNAAFTGKIGEDELGEIYQDKLQNDKVTPQLGTGEGVTGSSLILVTDDGARTMNTFLGMCQELSQEDIIEDYVAQASYLYIEGYLWDTETQQAAIVHAVELAKKHGTKIALSLSDAFCVQRHHNAFHELIRESVDMLFCNQEEAFALLNTQISQEALEFLANHVETIALTLGAKGALICKNKELFYVDPRKVDVTDTTGAGDAFAAGFLYGITNEKSPFESGMIASALASEVIQNMGPRFKGDARSRLKEILGDRL
jgi:sugar/nucleoside kinase (ribokinase family)